MKRKLAVLVENSPGVLTHVSGLISRRGYNIESIAASSTEKQDMTRISLVVDVADEWQYEQVVSQLEKLVQVFKVLDMTGADAMSREMALIKIKSDAALRQEVISVVDIFRGRIIDFNNECMVIEATNDSSKIDAFCKIMQKYGIIEIIRTGEICLSTKPGASAEEIY